VPVGAGGRQRPDPLGQRGRHRVGRQPEADGAVVGPAQLEAQAGAAGHDEGQPARPEAGHQPLRGRRQVAGQRGGLLDAADEDGQGRLGRSVLHEEEAGGRPRHGRGGGHPVHRVGGDDHDVARRQRGGGQVEGVVVDRQHRHRRERTVPG
jgi:hypothetical protein